MYNKIITNIAPQILRLKTDGRIFDYLNLNIFILMGVFLFFNPFSHTTAIKEICFYLSVFIVLILIFSKKTEFSFKSPLTLPFALFVIWAFIGLFSALYKENSIHDFYAHLLKYLAIYYILINFFNSRKRLIILSWILIVSVTAFSIGGMIYYYPVKGASLMSRITFQETSINIIGFVTLFAILLSLHHLTREDKLYRKIVLLVALAGAVVMTVLTQSMGTCLALIVSLLVLFPKNKKTVVIVFLIFSLLIGLITSGMIPVENLITSGRVKGKLNIHSSRMRVWNTYLQMIKDYPVTGIGFDMGDMWQDKELWNKYSAKAPTKWRAKEQECPHNLLVSTATRLGLVGLALFFYIIFAFARMSWITIIHGKDDFIKSWGLCITAAFIAWFTKGMFEPALSHVPAIILYTIFAMTTILWRLNVEEGKGQRSEVGRQRSEVRGRSADYADYTD